METKKNIAVIQVVFGLKNSKLEIAIANTEIDGVYPVYRINTKQLPHIHDVRLGTVIQYDTINHTSRTFNGLKILGCCIGPEANPELKEYRNLLK